MKETGQENSRRKFLMNLSLGLGGIVAAAAGIPVLGALFQPILKKQNQTWRSVARADSFKIGETRLVRFENAAKEPYAGVTAHSAAWLRKEDELNFTAFSANCTHLGCPIRWEKDAELFFCPCHGGVFHKDGSVAAGPPPKSLVRYGVRVKKGIIEVSTAPLPITDITA